MRFPIPQHPKFQVGEAAGERWVTWKWFSFNSLFGVAFALVWCGLTWNSGGMIRIPFLGIGGWLLYQSLAGVVNRTRVVVTRDELIVHHGPLPIRRGLRLDRGAARRVFYENRHQNNGDDGTTIVHDVFAENRGGQRVTVVKGLDTASEAAFIQQFVEQRLGLPSTGATAESR